MNAADKEERAKHYQALRNRIALIASERGLPTSETAKVMRRLKLLDLWRFSRRHGVDLAWLLEGRLSGLLKTVRKR